MADPYESAEVLIAEGIAALVFIVLLAHRKKASTPNTTPKIKRPHK